MSAQHPAPNRARLVAAALALSLPLVVVAAVDSLRLLQELSKNRDIFTLIPSIFATLLGELCTQNPALLVSCALLTVNLIFAHRATRPGLPTAIAAGLGATLAALAWWRMREYAPFARSLAVTLAFVLLGVGLALTHALITRPNTRPRLGVATLGLAGAGAIAALAVDQIAFAQRYHTLHSTLLMVATVLLHAALLGWTWRTPRPRRPAALFGGATVLTTLLVITASFAPLPPSALPYLRAYTTLARFHDRGPVEQPCTSPPAPLEADEALEIFAAQSHLPRLPETFSLEHHNVLFITIEALRASDTFIAQDNTTPRLAAFARDASVFTRAYSPSVSTVSTLSSLFGMAHPSQLPLIVGEQEWPTELELDRPTVPELLQRSGFHTFHAIGAFPAYRPLMRGFDDARTASGDDDATTDARITDDAIQAIDTASDSSKPFFGWVFLSAPHAPYSTHGPGADSERERYRQEIAYTDNQLDRLLQHIEAQGLLDDTIIVITSDHGEAFGEHRTYKHASTVYEETAHVPLVIRAPGLEPAREDRPVSTLHVLPWLLLRSRGETQRAAAERVQIDLAPIMALAPRMAVVEMLGRINMHVAFIGERHKLVYDMYAQLIRFFDLERDPDEQQSLFESSPDALTPFSQTLVQYLSRRACERRYAIRE